MSDKLINFFKKELYPFPFLLAVIVIYLSLVNYQSGTWLSGWDTLHPEFNFGNYFKRIVTVWQSHQGLGAPPSQAHAAEIPRMLIYYPLSWILPASFLRYSYFFLTLLLGVWGVYFFVKRAVFKNNLLSTCVAAFIGALFYLLNLVTLQHYFVPLEMFATQFASLGWLFLTATQYLEKKTNKSLIWFTLVTLAAAPMAHTATLWYAYFFCLWLFVLSYFILLKQRIGFTLILVTLAVNSFWLLPNLYYIKNHSAQVMNSKINTLFSQEAFVQNVEFGNIADLGLFKNFLFNWSDYDFSQGKFVKLMDEWENHLQQPLVAPIGYSFFVLWILGAIIAIIKKNKVGLCLVPVLLLSLFFWFNVNPPLGQIFSLIQKYLPLFREGFRFPFTKFSIILEFVCAVFLSLAIKELINLSRKFINNINIISSFWSIFLAIILIYFMLPAFNGFLISPSMKVKIPQEYFQLFNWFGREPPNERIANLPLHSFWGWQYYAWGYQGAGFLWFGIPGPLLDREFDRWYPTNEQYFREMSYAVYAQNLTLMEKVLEKYRVKWLLLDENVIQPGEPVDSPMLYIAQIKNLFSSSDKIKLTKTFGSKISVWEFKTSVTSDWQVVESVKKVEPKFTWHYQDQAYVQNGDYFSSPDVGQYFDYYPFRSIFSQADKLNASLINVDQNKISLNLEIPKIGIDLKSTTFAEDKILASVSLDNQNNSLQFEPIFPQIRNVNNQFKIFSLSLPYNLPSQFILALNRSDYILIDRSRGSQKLGEVNVFTHSNNNLKIYPVAGQRVLFSNFNNVYPQLASNPQQDQSYDFSGLPQENGFQLGVRNAKVFIPLSLNFIKASDLPNGEFLLDTAFNYSGMGSGLSYCFFDPKAKVCLNNNFQNSTTLGIRSVSELNSNNLSQYEFRFVQEAQDKEESVKVTNISFGIQLPVYSSSFIADFGLSQAVDLSGQADKIIVDTPLDAAIVSKNYDITQASKKGDFCGELVPIFWNKSISGDESKKYIQYQSQNGSVCDHFYYPDFDHNKGYLLEIQSKNITGLPLRFCLTNRYSQRCDIYSYLTQKQEFTKEYFLILPMHDNAYGWDVNINNYSIGKTISANDLVSINFYPLPTDFLQNLRLGNQTGVANVLESGQSYEDGWLAIIKKGTFSYKLLSDHVLVNNWANGWLLNKDDRQKDIKATYIFFVPQLLEYIGFGLLIGVGAWLVWIKLRKNIR